MHFLVLPKCVAGAIGILLCRVLICGMLPWYAVFALLQAEQAATIAAMEARGSLFGIPPVNHRNRVGILLCVAFASAFASPLHLPSLLALAFALPWHSRERLSS
jgi:hypothetical protein